MFSPQSSIELLLKTNMKILLATQLWLVHVVADGFRISDFLDPFNLFSYRQSRDYKVVESEEPHHYDDYSSYTHHYHDDSYHHPSQQSIDVSDHILPVFMIGLVASFFNSFISTVKMQEPEIIIECPELSCSANAVIINNDRNQCNVNPSTPTTNKPITSIDDCPKCQCSTGFIGPGMRAFRCDSDSISLQNLKLFKPEGRTTSSSRLVFSHF